MQLTDIYKPIETELKRVEDTLAERLGERAPGVISEINRHLLSAKGKRLRPALAILSARASSKRQSSVPMRRLVRLASALELIHMASLVHDDVIDKSDLRHNRPTVNARWGDDVSVAVGDYLYSEAFSLISDCGSPDIIACMSSAIKSMCEGELIQVCERENLKLLKRRYIVIVKKKTAALFAAACHAGTMLASEDSIIRNSLKEYGLNFGIAFQMRDDCMDLIGEVRTLGKAPGADFKMGELTLPALKLLSEEKDKDHIISLLKHRGDAGAFKEIRKRFINSRALAKAGEDISYYADKAKNSLNRLAGSCFKENLLALADYFCEESKRP
jgi:geranylgeranyl pyrophosphate synthase